MAVMKSLSKDPSDRQQSMSELSQNLSDAIYGSLGTSSRRQILAFVDPLPQSSQPLNSATTTSAQIEGNKHQAATYSRTTVAVEPPEPPNKSSSLNKTAVVAILAAVGAVAFVFLSRMNHTVQTAKTSSSASYVSAAAIHPSGDKSADGSKFLQQTVPLKAPRSQQRQNSN